SPSKIPSAIVSAAVERGLSVVASTSTLEHVTSGAHGPWTTIDVPPATPETQAMPKTVILSAARTPIGKMGGALASVDATELGGIAIKAALERADVAPEQVDHVVMGQVLQAGQGQIPSRQAQIKGGIPKEVSSETINKVCASSVRSAGIVDTGGGA